MDRGNQKIHAGKLTLGRFRRRGPRSSLEAVEFATLEWGDWFDNRRLLELIGNIPPADSEARCYARQDELAMATWRKQSGDRVTRRGSLGQQHH